MNEDDRKYILRLIEIEDLKAEREAAGPRERDIWIMASRRIFAPGPRQPCCVCGKFKSISQAHHVVPLATQYDRGFKYPDQEHVWLCPNHHAMVHLYIPGDDRSLEPAAMRARSRTTMAVSEDLSEEEFGRMMELMRRSARSPE
jgi:hypothetical protein